MRVVIRMLECLDEVVVFIKALNVGRLLYFKLILCCVFTVAL
jgi:hypothetical protein